MEGDNLKQYTYESSDKNKTLKLEFHCNMLNDMKIIFLFGKPDTKTKISFEMQFDLETIKKINQEINKYILKQEKIKEIENLNKIRSSCKHINAKPSHPYGDIWCPDCKKCI